jgi:type I restriction enzyme S subunit
VNLELVPLVSLAAVRSGGGAPQEATAFGTSGLPFIRAGSLPKLLDGAGEDSLEKIEPEVADRYGLKVFPAGTVLFAKSGMSATKGYVYRLRGPAYVVNHLAALVPHDLADAAFLERALQRFSPTVLVRDPAYPSIRLGEIESMKVLAPRESSDRGRIVEILDKADALRAKRRTTLAQLDTLRQSMFLEMFGDPATNPKGWPVQQLRNVVKVGTIVTYGIVQAGEEDPGGVPYIRTGDIGNGIVVAAELRHTDPAIAARFLRSRVEAGDIVMSIRATVGTTALIPPELDGANLTQGTARISPGENTEPLYLLTFLRTSGTQHWIGLQIKGATFREITLTRLRDLPVALPPIELQQQFVRRVTELVSLEASYRESLTELDALFASIQHRAFRGELW